MALSNAYTTLAIVKSKLGIDDTDDNGLLEHAINAVSRAIDNITGTHFYAATQTRTYTPIEDSRLDVDDLLSVTTLKGDYDNDGTYETTWASTDYKLYPRNAATDSKPYKWIQITPYGNYYFPQFDDAVQIVGSFGYNSGTSENAPYQIREACALMAMRLWKRKDNIYGVSGLAALGTVEIVTKIREDEQVMALLNSVASRSPIPLTMD